MPHGYLTPFLHSQESRQILVAFSLTFGNTKVMRNPTIVDEYLDHFCGGNIDGVESTLADDFRLRGPLFELDSRDAYIQSLRDSPLEKASYRILAISQTDDTVSVFYEYKKSSCTNVVAQFFRTRDDKIVETLLVFDRSAVV